MPGLQPALADDRRRIEVEDARLGSEYDEAVLGHPEATRPQAIAVEHRSDERAVGEGHVGRAIPGLHHRRVVLVERTPRGIHVDVVLPRLGDHHEDRMRKGTSP